MAQRTANSAGDTADPISNAVTSPQASLFIRQILQAALQNSAGAAQPWVAEAHALLANVMMNDCLNWWDDTVTPADAQKHVDQAMGPPSPPDSVLALAHHAQGLIFRAQRNQLPLKEFEKAVSLDPGFARAYAQVGNQTALGGDPTNSHGHFKTARCLAPYHPASGYFDWAEGRAYFLERNWPEAIKSLKSSVAKLKTVWYNRCYLAAAQDSSSNAADKADALKTKKDFIDASSIPGSGIPTLKVVEDKLQKDSNPATSAARATVLAFLQKP
jgi:hypothetical protein